MTQPLILVDSCIWNPYFQRRGSPVRQHIERLLVADKVVLIGPIVTEILRGIRREEHAQWVASALAGPHFEPLRWDDWAHAASLGRQLAAKGHSDFPLADLVIAAAALDRGWQVYSDDPHFDLIDWLPRFRPD